MKSPTSLLRKMLIDFSIFHSGVKGFDRDIITIERRFKEEGNGFLSIALPSLGKAVDYGLSQGTLTVPLGFAKRGALPIFLSGLLREIFNPKTGKLVDEPDIGVVKSVRQLLYVYKKAIPSTDLDSRLDRKAVRSFWDTDAECISVLTDVQKHWLSSVSSVLLKRGVLSSDESDGKHGPGSVYEGLTANQKWVAVANALRSGDERLYDAGYDTLMDLFHDGDLEKETTQDLTSLGYWPSEQPFRGVARLVTVPKSSTSKRTITVEPVLNQFLQQRLNRLLRKSIRKCHVLRNCLALSDQSENQKLAVIGSLTGGYSTIDLSSASDLLSHKLVEFVFTHLGGNFLPDMVRCRTPWVSDSEKSQELRKYAGMGNATTFPVQSIVFAIIAIIGTLKSLGCKPSYKNVLRASKLVRVYGDDIIVSTCHFHHVASEITGFGLRLNWSKTFSTGNFRESCGVDAFKGVDVTPAYAKTYPGHISGDLDHLGDMVHFRNAMRHGFMHHTAEAVQRYVEKVYHLPYITPELYQKRENGSFVKSIHASSDIGGLGWVERNRCFSFGRINVPLQRVEIRLPVLSCKVRKDPIDGIPALLKFFHASALERSQGLNLSQSPRRFSSKLRWRWVPSHEGKVLYN